MSYRIAADAVLLLHLAFIAFVMLGAIAAARRPALMLLHLPAVAWAVYTETTGTICPLTYVENALRAAAGASGYAGSFVEHYVFGVIYPKGLTPTLQWLLALVVIAINGSLYARLLRMRVAPRTEVR